MTLILHVMIVTLKTLYVMVHSIRSMEYYGGLIMGLTPDQKIELALAYIKKCDDVYLIMNVANAAHERLNKLLED